MARYTAEEITDILLGEEHRITAPIAQHTRTRFAGINWLATPLKDTWQKDIVESDASLAQSNRELGYIGFQMPQLEILYLQYIKILIEEAAKTQQIIAEKIKNRTLLDEIPDEEKTSDKIYGVLDIKFPISNLQLGFTFAASSESPHLNFASIFETLKENLRERTIRTLGKNPFLTLTQRPRPPEIS